MPFSADKQRERAAAAPPDDGAQAAESHLDKLAQVAHENECLAEEVLRNYEQLNLLFDIAVDIASVTDPREIERRLLCRLGSLLAVEFIDIVPPDGAPRRYDTRSGLASDAAPRALGAALLRALEETRRDPTVAVKDTQDERVLIGPLQRIDDRVDILIAQRPPAGPDFVSGDLRLVESLLAFGGQIMCNAELHDRLRRMSMEITRALVAAIDKKDRYTSGHSERVGFLSRLTGEGLGLPAAELEQLEWAGLLHDVGKIGVPEEILNKPGKLTDEEFEVIKRHPTMGYEILKPIKSFQAILDGVLYHHENPDGSGYPEGLVGEQTPLTARIIHVVDVFDALTSNRSYRGKFPILRALEILREEAGTKLDGQVVAVFLSGLNALRQDHERFTALFPHLEDASHETFAG